MKIIVICTGNTCRSQIAEGLLKTKYPEFEIYSAGTKPEAQVNPYAVKAMKDRGIDISQQYPKLVDEFIDQYFDYVLTVCDSAKEICPIFTNAKNKIHNSFVDPSQSSYESEEAALTIYKNTVDEISNWFDTLTFS
ncbi:MAG: arsenate reductase ArsC [Actinomycetota bacterium]|nr:arsenate reductase ArsC [Actinomycetota bacterium]MDA3013914.1 arsenate reductase ArsC [Actinomycetota bacterium]